MNKRAVLYARVSKDDTRNDDRNLEGQLDMCRQHAATQGWRIVAELAEDDRGASGVSLDLAQLNRIREMAQGGEFDVLVVREIDRLSRSLAKQLLVEDELNRNGVRIEYVLGEYSDTPEGSLNKNIKAVIAEYERLKIAERMTRGRRQIVKSGVVMLHGNRPPYGYRVSEDGKGLVVLEPEAHVVRLIFAWHAEGDESGRKLGRRAIARRLSEMAVPTWRDIHGGAAKKRRVGEWSDGAVSGILTNETYVGHWHYGRRSSSGKRNPRSHWLKVEVPPIITSELWEMTQERKKQNRAMAKRHAKHDYLMGKRLTCGQCGHKMYGRGVRRDKRIYNCATRVGEIVGQKCDLPYFDADQVDKAVWGWVKSFLSDPVALRDGLSAYQSEQEHANKPVHDRLAVVTGLIADNQARLERLLDLYLAGDFPKDMLVERKTGLETKLATLEKEQSQLTAQLKAHTLSHEQMSSLQGFAVRVAEGLEQADGSFEARRQIIEIMDVRGTLAVEEGEMVAYVRCLLGDNTVSIANGSTCSTATSCHRVC